MRHSAKSISCLVTSFKCINIKDQMVQYLLKVNLRRLKSDRFFFPFKSPAVLIIEAMLSSINIKFAGFYFSASNEAQSYSIAPVSWRSGTNPVEDSEFFFWGIFVTSLVAP